jgi:hypothetical protein
MYACRHVVYLCSNHIHGVRDMCVNTYAKMYLQEREGGMLNQISCYMWCIHTHIYIHAHAHTHYTYIEIQRLNMRSDFWNICVHACLCVQLQYLPGHTHTCIHIHAHIHAWYRISTYIRIYIYIRTYPTHTYQLQYLRAPAYAHTYTHTHMHACMVQI